MLVIRNSDGRIRWMDVTAYLRRARTQTPEDQKRISFEGEAFNVVNVARMRDRLLRGSDLQKNLD